jgi:hypothetical protein
MPSAANHFNEATLSHPAVAEAHRRRRRRARPAQPSQHVAPSGGSPTRRGVKRENWRRTIMHPMFVMLFIETDADDALTEQQDRKRRAHAARRGRSARVVKVAAANRDRPPRP